MRQSEIISTHFTTEDLPVCEQFDAYRTWVSVVFDVQNRRDPLEGFQALSTAFYVGDIVVALSDLDAQRFLRTSRRIRCDQIDHFLLTLYRSRSGRGRVAVTDLGQPLVSDEPRRACTSIFLPRELMESRVPDLATLHLQPVTGPYSQLLGDYFDLLARSLPTLLSQSGDELAEATCDMLVACVRPSIEHTQMARAQLDAVLARQAKRHIGRQLRCPDLSANSIAACLGVSRRTLYRVFEPTGGIQKYIQGKRLDAVRAELLDHTHRRKVSEIAEASGFTRMDYFSRVFKKRFGHSPRAIRGTITLSEPPSCTPAAASRNATFPEWIRELGI